TPLREAVTWAIEAGDLDSASNATLMQVSLVFAAGLHLRSLERSSNVAAHRMQQWQAGEQEIMARVFERFAGLLLAGDPEAVEARLEDPFDLAVLLPTLELGLVLQGIWALEAVLCVLFDRPARALELYAEIDRLGAPRQGAWLSVYLAGFRGLAAADLCGRAETEDERAALRSIIEDELARLRTWAAVAPENFSHLEHLLAGELRALDGDPLGALALLGRARRAAKAARLPLFEALAYERMAKLVLDVDIEELGVGPIREAVARYHHWGAFSKAVALERRWPELFADVQAGEAGGENTRTGQTSNSTSGRSLDMA
ncbi:MAG: hypothetical protein KC457_34560, partial [Myxococcales bacterium]|nr:hypothetical protein [Myxococcales bacterium]